MSHTPLPVVVLGAAGTGLFMAEAIDRTPAWHCVGMLDDAPAKQQSGYYGLPVLGRLEAWRDLPEHYRFLNSLHDAKRNALLCERVRALAIPEQRWATVVDPTAVVSPRAVLGAGVFVGPRCVVGPAARLGNNCLLIGGVYIAHHGSLGNDVACANGVSLAGGASVGDAAYLGVGAMVRQYVRIGPKAVVGMGSVVLRDVDEGQTVVGNPAKPL